MQSYAGNYAGGARKILLENGKLYSQRTGQPKYELIPLANDLFMMEKIPYLRIKIRTNNDKVTAFVRLYNDGSNFIENRDQQN